MPTVPPWFTGAKSQLLVDPRPAALVALFTFNIKRATPAEHTTLRRRGALPLTPSAAQHDHLAAQRPPQPRPLSRKQILMTSSEPIPRRAASNVNNHDDEVPKQLRIQTQTYPQIIQRQQEHLPVQPQGSGRLRVSARNQVKLPRTSPGQNERCRNTCLYLRTLMLFSLTRGGGAGVFFF